MTSKGRDPRAQLAENRYDGEAWAALVRETRNRPGSGAAELRKVLEELLEVFPTAAQYWKLYAEAELADNNIAGAKAVFGRCLKGHCPSVDLWRCYLQFIKKMNDGRGGSGDAVQVQKAFEYTLNQIGNDLAAGVIWQDYISFLKAPKVGSPAYAALFGGGVAGQEESRRTVELRRAYQRAIVIPTASIDNLWRSYETFEKEASKHLAAPMLTEQKHKYQAAKTVFQERRRLQDGIKWDLLALPLAAKSAEMEKQALLWRAYIAYEASNPQQLEKGALQGRVGLAYDQALMFLYHYPELWHDAAAWHVSHPLGGGRASAAHVFERAKAALPGCAMLRYAAADMEEAASRECAAEGQDVEAEERLKDAEAIYKALVGDGEEGEEEVQAGLEARALSWVLYMRFARRARSVKASREVFMRARKWAECPWQVYVASARMEWECSREEKVARNIFENGLKKFMTNKEYVEAYVDFLLGLGDVVNGRTLYERALQESPGQAAAQPLWDSFVRFEYRVGSIEAVRALEGRRRDALLAAGAQPQSDALSNMALRYCFMGMWPAEGTAREYMQATLAGKQWSSLGAPPPTAPKAAAQPAPGPAAPAAGRPADARSPLRAPEGAPAGRPNGGGSGGGGGAPSQSQGPGSGSGPPRHEERRPPSPGRRPPAPGPPRPAPAAAPMPMPGPNEPLKQLPPALGRFIVALPQKVVEGRVPPVDLVIDVLMSADLSPAALMAAAEEGVRGRPPEPGPPGHMMPPGGGGPPQGPPMGGPHPGGGPGGPFPGGPGGGPFAGGKRRHMEGGGGFGPDGGGGGGPPQLPDNRPPAFDIYRQRRRQKMGQDGGR
eukprot:jgi/Tetstr1/445641/TSEL_003446.t1